MILSSLFGDLPSPNDRRRVKGDDSDSGFAATAIMEEALKALGPAGQLLERNSSDVVVDGSPAKAIRAHFAQTRADMSDAHHLMTLLDPGNVWASSIIRALSEAGGYPVERADLREAGTLRTLASIERTIVQRPQQASLRVMCGQVRVPGTENAEITNALMETSHMVVVVFSNMQPHAVDGLLQQLEAASHAPHWRCPQVLFLVPPSQPWISQRVASLRLPRHVQGQWRLTPLSSPSSIWNTILETWKQVGPSTWTAQQPDVAPESAPEAEFPIRMADLRLPPDTLSMPLPAQPAEAGRSSGISFAQAQASGVLREPLTPLAQVQATRRAERQLPPQQPSPPTRLDPVEAYRNTLKGQAKLSRQRMPNLRDIDQAMAGLMRYDGVLACGLIDLSDGTPIAMGEHHAQPEFLRAVAAGAIMLVQQMLMSQELGMRESLEESVVSSAHRQVIWRTLTGYPGLALMLMLNRQAANVALARFKLMDLERALA